MRVQNLTTGCWIRMSRAERSIRECAAAWVDYGHSLRNLTLTESLQARFEQARLREPMPWAEIPSLHFDHPGVSGEWPLTHEANSFAKCSSVLNYLKLHGASGAAEFYAELMLSADFLDSSFKAWSIVGEPPFSFRAGAA